MREANPHRMTSGSWLVIALLGIGVVAAVVGLKVRRSPADRDDAATRPATQPVAPITEK